MLLKFLYAVLAVLILVVGWQFWSQHRINHFLESQSLAQSYGAAPDKAKVTIVAFMDYTCRTCKDTNAAVLQAVSENPDARIFFHPLPQSSSALSMMAARAALAAAKQGQFMAMHEELMRNEKPLTDDLILGFAEKFNIDPAQLNVDSGSDDVTARLQKTYDAAAALMLQATPSFIFNHKLIYVPVQGDPVYRNVLQLIQQTRS
ncbi:MAG: thioredoxin domain-containing protein [Micavibrio sp.]